MIHREKQITTQQIESFVPSEINSGIIGLRIVSVVATLWVILASGVRTVFAQDQPISMISLVDESPINGDGTWNWEVLLTNQIRQNHTIQSKEVATLFSNLVQSYQASRKNRFESIETILPKPIRELREREIEAELQRKLGQTLEQKLPNKVIEDLKSQAMQWYYKNNFWSELALKLDSLELSLSQSTAVAKLEKQLEKEYQEAYSKLLIEEGEELFSQLNGRQQSDLWRLLDGRESYRDTMRKIDYRFPTSLMRKYHKNISDSTYEGFIDFSRLLINQEVLKEIKVTEEQQEECLQAFMRHTQRFRTLMLDGKQHEAADAVKQLEQHIKIILLPEQVTFLEKAAYHVMLQKSPMNFLVSNHIRHELKINPDQREALVKAYAQISAKGDRILSGIKDKMDQRVLELLNPTQQSRIKKLMGITD